MIDRIRLVAAREVRAERGQPEGLIGAATFIAVLIFVESLAIGPLAASQPPTAAALYWVGITFAAILVASRAFDRELEDDAIDAILALPGGRDALYAGKAIALTALLAIVAVIGGALALVLIPLTIAEPVVLLAVVVAGIIALPPIVTLTVVLALRLRARGALVPILALPMLVPHLVAATYGCAAAASGDVAGALAWSGLLVAFALVYWVLGFTIVPAALE